MNTTTAIPARFIVSDFQAMKEKLLTWAQSFSTFCFLDNHQYASPAHTMECLLGAGVKKSIRANAGSALDLLDTFISGDKTWLFGHLGYDLKNELEQVDSSHPDFVGFPDLFFFEPEVLIRLHESYMDILAEDPARLFQTIDDIRPLKKLNESTGQTPLPIQSRIDQTEYVAIIRKLKEHILYGDCYEINFCQEFFVDNAQMDPLLIYQLLSQYSPNPFSALYRTGDQWLICASPERFLKRQGDKILSQPIKGTARRVTADRNLDEMTRKELSQSPKDRSENVMVVDLVRNDLAKVCEEGSVVVDELYGVYTFPQVHQMISTVSGHLKENMKFTDIIRATFPMGSMTGAPKKRVMELIEHYEKSRRGIFSGAVGYLNPEGDFDFNVVIRSILYNAATHYLSFPAGSGITFYSDPEKEWEECMLKAEAIRHILGS